MKTDVQCPNCQGNHIKTATNTLQIVFGSILLIAGLGFLITAVTAAVGYYLFALPLCTIGSISIYKGRTDPLLHAHCKDCKHEFECLVN
ncbi:MAG: hypothetical protein V4592_16005 [Bacteroidota bacterium]